MRFAKWPKSLKEIVDLKRLKQVIKKWNPENRHGQLCKV